MKKLVETRGWMDARHDGTNKVQGRLLCLVWAVSRRRPLKLRSVRRLNISSEVGGGCVQCRDEWKHLDRVGGSGTVASGGRRKKASRAWRARGAAGARIVNER